MVFYFVTINNEQANCFNSNYTQKLLKVDFRTYSSDTSVYLVDDLGFILTLNVF